MYGHSVDSGFSREVAVRPPQESQEALVVFWNSALVKHCLNVCDNGYLLSSEADKHTGEVVHQNRALQNGVVETSALVDGSTVKHDAALAWIALLEHRVVRQIPLATWFFELSCIETPGMAVGNVLFYRSSILAVECLIIDQLLLEVPKASLSDLLVARQGLRINLLRNGSGILAFFNVDRVLHGLEGLQVILAHLEPGLVGNHWEVN